MPHASTHCADLGALCTPKAGDIPTVVVHRKGIEIGGSGARFVRYWVVNVAVMWGAISNFLRGPLGGCRSPDLLPFSGGSAPQTPKEESGRPFIQFINLLGPQRSNKLLF